MEADELELLFEVFEDAPRQGPGSVETTRHALQLLPDSLRVERVLDLGCGTGGSSIVLAQDTRAHVTVVDIHPPFLAALRARAGELGLADRITTVAADMANATSLGTGFDLVWAEGSAYSIGFENALRSWRPLLRSGGCLVVTELVWFVSEPAERARAFFADEYPDIRDEARCIGQARSAGYELLASFRLPADDWHAYYGGLELPLRNAIARRGELDVYAAIRREGEVYEACGDDYGYLCLVLQVAAASTSAGPWPPDESRCSRPAPPADERQAVGAVSSMDYVIRPMSIEDYDAVLELWRTTEGIVLSDTDEREPIRGFLARNPELSSVALCRGELAGAVLGSHDGRRGYLHHLATVEELRCHGIGSALVQETLSRLGRAGIRKCNVFVLPENSEGLAFWERNGFRLLPPFDCMQAIVEADG